MRYSHVQSGGSGNPYYGGGSNAQARAQARSGSGAGGGLGIAGASSFGIGIGPGGISLAGANAGSLSLGRKLQLWAGDVLANGECKDSKLQLKLVYSHLLGSLLYYTHQTVVDLLFLANTKIFSQ